MKIYKNGKLVADTQVSEKSTITATAHDSIRTVSDLKAFANTGQTMRFADEDEMFHFFMNVLDASEVGD